MTPSRLISRWALWDTDASSMSDQQLVPRPVVVLPLPLHCMHVCILQHV